MKTQGSPPLDAKRLIGIRWNWAAQIVQRTDRLKTEPSRQVKDYKPTSLKEALAEPEKDIIRRALEANHWSRQATAKALQINRTTLFKKMKHFGLYAEAERLGLT